jgi:pilus assembly protein CpaC
LLQSPNLTVGVLLLLAASLKTAAAQSEGKTLHIFVGKSVVINLQTPITRVLSSNPQAIDTVATSATQIVVEGRAPGSSNLIIWDQSGHSQMLDVTVEVNVSSLRSAIQQAYPGQTIDVQSDGAHLILTGTVSDSKISDEVAKMAAAYAPGVVNLLTVAPVHEQQVLLEVKFAEVDRTKMQALGINLFSTGAANTVGTVSTQQFAPPSLTSTTSAAGTTTAGGTETTNFTLSDLLNIFAFRRDINLGVTIRDLENKSVLQILAEPNLLALNGQKASFLAGGEFPYPVVQGAQNFGVVTIQFRPFGVRLEFTAFIGADNVIRLHIIPEVSTLDFTNAVTISGFTVPALSTRRAETEIELKDGQSFGIAGLLDQRAQTQLSKIPGIGDIPILGNFFRSHSLNRSNSELVVLATPRIVDPSRAATPPPVPPAAPIKFLENSEFDRHLPARSNQGRKETTNPSTPSAK